MSPFSIEPAVPADLSAVLRVYEAARAFMAATGNPHQWGTSFPPKAQLCEDIALRQLYVARQDGTVHGVFAGVPGPDPSYTVIENGAWRSETPYLTLHRVASDGTIHGFFAAAVAFCERITPHLRVDTHDDNAVMQHLIEKTGFQYCGRIYVEDGTPRRAYEKLPCRPD